MSEAIEYGASETRISTWTFDFSVEKNAVKDNARASRQPELTIQSEDGVSTNVVYLEVDFANELAKVDFDALGAPELTPRTLKADVASRVRNFLPRD